MEVEAFITPAGGYTPIILGTCIRKHFEWS